MSVRVRVALVAGRPVAVKTATTPDQVARLQNEVARLRRLHHPGLVRLVDSGSSGRSVEMRTAYAGDPLDRWRGTLPRAASIAATVAATLADLHGAGVVHGQLDGSHVLIGADGHPRLCSLSERAAMTPADDVETLGRVVMELVERSVARRRGPLPWARRRDTQARALQQAAQAALDPVPSRRPSARRLARAILEAVPAAEPLAPRGEPEPRHWPTTHRPPAAAGDASNRVPPRATVRSATAATAPPMRQWKTGDAGRDARQRHSRPGQPLLAAHRRGDGTKAIPPRVAGATVAGLVALAIIAGGTVAMRRAADTIGDAANVGQPRAEAPRREDAAARRTSNVGATLGVGQVGDVDDAGKAGEACGSREAGEDCEAREAGSVDASSKDPTGRRPTAPRCPDVAWPAADVDHDGCQEAVRVDGRTVEAGASRWVLGEPGDVVAVGSWDCSGSAFPALLRPATGDVFVFRTWAAAGEPVTVESRHRVDGARDIRAEPVADGCDALVIERATGEDTVVEVDRDGTNP
jgi:hypothetical protein